MIRLFYRVLSIVLAATLLACASSSPTRSIRPPENVADCDETTSDGSTKPRPWLRIAPYYPQAAARKGTSGRVLMEVVLALDGTVASVRVLASEPRGVFDESAMKSLRGWRYCGSAQGYHHPEPFKELIAFGT